MLLYCLALQPVERSNNTRAKHFLTLARQALILKNYNSKAQINSLGKYHLTPLILRTMIQELFIWLKLSSF
jgi:hypothetical protein